MLTHFGVDLLVPEWSESVVCVGAFDGVHLGHQALIRAAVGEASSSDRPCVLVTFDRHPAAVLAPDRRPPSIGTLEQNLGAFRRLGVALCVILRFDRALADMSAQEFLDSILFERLRATGVVVGHDFAMGHGRQGDADWLGQRIPTTVVPPFLIEGRRVSSTALRLLVAEGRVEEAERLLGRRFSIPGVVVAGRKLGRELGFPTVNLARAEDQVVPRYGVYAGYAATPKGRFRAAISVGLRPTVDGKVRAIEANLLDYPGDNLYGSAVEIEFHSRLRDEEAFPSLEELKAQMARDVERVLRIPAP